MNLTPTDYTVGSTPAVRIADPNGSAIQINKPGTDDPLVTLLYDGTLVFGEGYEPDDAARIFWNALRDSFPGLIGPVPTAR